MAKYSSSERPKRGYLPTLDGWRTVSIVAVILCHDTIHRWGFLNTGWMNAHGNRGVDIFFAISGLLICSRLLSEEETTGSISISRFYLRRALRILPPALFYLGTLAILSWVAALPVGLPEIAVSLLFFRNYTTLFSHFQPQIYPFYTSHFWSLAVEEHFYLMLPALLVFSPKKWRVPALLGLAAFVTIVRSLDTWTVPSIHTTMKLDSLLVPAALAILLDRHKFPAWLLSLLRFWPILAIFLLIVMTPGTMPHFEATAVAWLTPFVILGTMLHPQSLFGRFLESAPMRYFGRLSYSIYLWQQLFFVGHFGDANGTIAPLQRWPLCLVMTVGCAMLSYYLVERPFIRLGHRLASGGAGPSTSNAASAKSEPVRTNEIG